jgi:glycosyltransferase involved in cell wall biosynthesis
MKTSIKHKNSTVQDGTQSGRDSVTLLKEMTELTILMPCLNESETIGACVEKAANFLSENLINGEIIIADNGSTDGSQLIAKKLGARVISVQQRGYGAALIAGIEAARGHYVVMGDSDDSYDFSNLMPFVYKLRAGADLVIGNRFRGGIERGAMPWLHRRLGNPVLSFIGRLFFRCPVSDFQCGLRGFKTIAIRRLGLQATGMEFASEMIVRSALAGFNIQEVPTTLAVDGRNRPSHLRSWRDGWRHLKFLLMYSPRWLYLIPGAAMVLLGFTFATALMPGPLVIIEKLGLDLNSFIASCFLVVVGVQFLTIGAIARLFAMRAGFLPQSKRAEFLLGWLSTDRLLKIAVFLLTIAALGLTWAIWQWVKVDFGPLHSSLIPRVMIASLCGVVIAAQTAGAAFLLGILEIPFVDRS